jgi:uncharacterized membrane protein (UPF0127 family)
MATGKLRLRREGDDAVICDELILGDSFRQRFMGLMGRASMPDGHGLYLPANSIHMMFMRFPIDALFVSKEGEDGRRSVVSTRSDLPTWRGIVMPVRGAEGVVEMRAGTLDRAGVAAGDTVVFEPIPTHTPEAGA